MGFMHPFGSTDEHWGKLHRVVYCSFMFGDAWISVMRVDDLRLLPERPLSQDLSTDPLGILTFD